MAIGRTLGRRRAASIRASAGDRTAAWLQFPRRVVLLLMAFGLATLLIYVIREALPTTDVAQRLMASGALPRFMDWSTSTRFREPVATIISQRLPNSLSLLGMTFVFTLALVLPGLMVSWLVGLLERYIHPVGWTFRQIGRLILCIGASGPAFVVGLFLIVAFAVHLRWLDAAGMGGTLSDLPKFFSHVLMPGFALALYPAALITQATDRALAYPREQAGVARAAGELLRVVGVLLGQTGGFLSALIAVEGVFTWPGLGRLAYEAGMSGDLPVLVGLLGTFVTIVLVSRISSELFSWLARLVGGEERQVALAAGRPAIARFIPAVFAVVLLVIPLGIALAGLAVDNTALYAQDIRNRLASPSLDHPLGTDALGRDLQARLLRGGLTTLGGAAVAAIALLIPAAVGGALTGYLASRRRWWSELLADLLLLPAEVLSLFPALVFVITLRFLFSSVDWWLLAFAAALTLLPRAIHFCQALWTSAPRARNVLLLGLAGLGALFVGSLFASLLLLISLDFLGFGAPPPLPTLGSVLSDGRQYITSSSIALFAGLFLWACAFSFKVALDALTGYCHGKDALVRWNE